MNKNPGIIGTKVGMTQLFLEDGTVLPCTVIHADCRVVGKRTQAVDGYDAVILGFGERKPKHLSKAVATAYEKRGQTPPRVAREIRMSAEDVASYELGQAMDIADTFQEGQFVDVQAQSKGRGFTGVMRRHNFKGAKNSHGAHEWTRHGGSIGTTTTPGRVMLGTKMPGQHGNKTVTVLSQRIAKLIPEKKLILLHGNVPGAPSGFVRVQGAVKKRNAGKPAAE